MKLILGIIINLALATGSKSEERFDPCLFIDCTKLTTTTKAPTGITPKTKLENVPKTKNGIDMVQSKLVCT